MKAIKFVVAGVVIALLGIGWFTFTRHVVRTKEGVRVVQKTKYGFHDIYVDTTQWGIFDYGTHPEVMAALANDELERGRAKLDAAKEQLGAEMDKATKELDKQRR